MFHSRCIINMTFPTHPEKNRSHPENKKVPGFDFYLNVKVSLSGVVDGGIKVQHLKKFSEIEL